MIKINNAEISEEEFNKIAEQQGFVRKYTMKKRWRAKYGCVYYSVAIDGKVCKLTESLSEYDTDVYKSGNYFKTEEEAQAYWGRKLAKRRVVDRLREIEGDWKADWKDGNIRKYTAIYNHIDRILGVNWDIEYQSTDIELYSSKEAWQQVREQMPDDVKLMMGVEKRLILQKQI